MNNHAEKIGRNREKMAKKRHWKKRAKLQAGLNSTENIKVTEKVDEKELSSQKQSESFNEGVRNRKPATEGISDDKLLSTKVIAGETCLDIECGSNKAVLYLSKMCLGSKGSCILFKGSWLTPNEFQFVSGRENAKDWKRSIRHNGSSLKLLFSKNLLKMQESPKKPEEISEEKENNELVLAEMSPRTTEEAATEKQENSPEDVLVTQKDDNLNTVSSEPAFVPIVENNDECKGSESGTSIEGVSEYQDPVPQVKDEAATENSYPEAKKFTDSEKTEETSSDNGNEDSCTEAITATTEVVMETSEEVQETEEAPKVPTPQPTTKQTKGRKKRAKKGWARQKSRTSTPVGKSRKSRINEADLPVKADNDDVTCAYENLKEEDKLAVFVKALRLLRKRDAPETIPNVPDPMPSPQHQEETENNEQASKLQNDVEDLEMPVLEKEVDLFPNRIAEPVQPAIFPSTVTPPPTPPLTASPDIDEIKRELKNIDQSVFESKLTPVEDGIKLKINRLVDESEKSVKLESVEIDIPEQKHQIVTSVVDKDSEKHTDSFSTSVTETHANPIDSSGLSKDVNEVSGKQTVTVERHKNDKNSLPCLPLVCPKKSEDFHTDFSSCNSQNNGATLKGNEKRDNYQLGGVSMVSTPYGPMVMPTEENFRLYHELLAAYSTMQHSIMRPEVTEKFPKGCVPNKMSVNHILPSVTQKQSTKIAYQQGKSALFEGTNFKTKRNSGGVVSPTGSAHGVKCETENRKRKYSECEGALDLSIKKPKTESPTISDSHQYNYIMDQDAPIDFSMKKTTRCDNAKPVNTKKQQNFISPVHRSSSIQTSQCRSNISTYPVWNTGSWRCANNMENRQSNKSIPNRNEQSKSSYNSMWNGITRHLEKDMTRWTVNDVCSFLSCLEGCSDYIKIFRDQGINGRILPFLTTQHLTRTLGMNVGPALALQYAIGRFFKDNANPNHLSSRSRVSV